MDYNMSMLWHKQSKYPHIKSAVNALYCKQLSHLILYVQSYCICFKRTFTHLFYFELGLLKLCMRIRRLSDLLWISRRNDETHLLFHTQSICFDRSSSHLLYFEQRLLELHIAIRHGVILPMKQILRRGNLVLTFYISRVSSSSSCRSFSHLYFEQGLLELCMRISHQMVTLARKQ